jgi:L-aspartate oxidase
MGGVRTDLHGRTSLAGLYAAGEVACTGVHGANRLASNSLLEGLVFGNRAGIAMREYEGELSERGTAPLQLFPEMPESDMRSLTWENCGILRSAAGLTETCRVLEGVGMARCGSPARQHFELRNIHEVSLLIARCALAREESRGGHYRTDFPESRAEFQKHSYLEKGDAVRFA